MREDYKYLKFIWFKDLTRWDVKSYIKQSNTKLNLSFLRDHIKEESKKVKLFEEKEAEFGILGVNNKEGIFDAYLEYGKNINQPYKEVKEGWIAYNPYRVNVGSVGLKKEEHKYRFISPAYVVFSCKETILPEFLFILFKTESFNKLITDNTTGSVRQILSFENLGNIQIPLPSIEVQRGLVESYSAKMNEAKEKEERTSKLEAEIETYLKTALGIEVRKQEEKHSKYKYLKFIQFSNLSRWGVEYIINNLSTNNILQSSKYQMEALGKIILINPTTNFKEVENKEVSFLPMECVSDVYGEVMSYKEGKASLAKGYTKFKEGDLLWAKITPCMQNGKSAIVKNLENGYGYGSTEFYVLRNSRNNVDLEYIYNLLRMQIVRKSATIHFTGSAGQQRVPEAFLKNLQIPLPPIEVQKEIAGVIAEMKSEIKLLRSEAENLKSSAKEEFEIAVFN